MKTTPTPNWLEEFSLLDGLAGTTLKIQNDKTTDEPILFFESATYRHAEMVFDKRRRSPPRAWIGVNEERENKSNLPHKR